MISRDRMKRLLSYVVFLVILIAIISFGYKALSDEEVVETQESSIPQEKPKVFTSDRLGVSFSYPGTWTMEPVEVIGPETGTLFLGVDANCTNQCQGFQFELIPKKSSDDEKENPLVAEFNKEGVLDKGTFLALVKAPTDGAPPELLLYNKKDTIYRFATTATLPQFSYDSIIESFQEIPKVVAVSTPPQDSREFKFEKCGNLADFQDQTFYSDFVAKLIELPRYHQPLFVRSQGMTKIIPENATDVCFSQTGNMMIMLLAGKDYCERGSIVKYETDTGKIVFADVIPATSISNGLHECGSFRNFGKRVGRFITTTAEFGDAGVSMKWTLLYDYIDNVLYGKELCVTTQDETKPDAAPKTECKPI